ncbi:hypothetical protein [Nannocystis pusilla]|uniref:Lipoprotein n=1 Tax=Nannocystis pusilla TaxID=889268 RepID=A0ABS7U0T3_9BACT|nr:hypothetical protein [Nannocystis pusilla]MBZ5714135.1 hypothetical protein [Nannocystis pusilla]
MSFPASKESVRTPKWPRVCGGIVALGFACENDTPVPESEPVDSPDAEIVYSSEHIDIAPLGSEALCAGTLAMLDDHVEYVLDMLELGLEERITIYLFLKGADVPIRKWCRQDVSGCARGTTIYSVLSLLPHEIVHAITSSEGRSWWEEGAARGLGDPSTFPDLLTGWQANLGGAGHLSRWLIERFGGRTYMNLYARTPYGASQAKVEAVARTVLGREFDDVLDEYAATAPFVYPHHWECYVSSEAVAVPWEDEYWEVEVDLDCDRTDTFSSHVAIYGMQMTARVPVTLPANGSYFFVADHPDANLAIQPCASEPRTKVTPGAYSWPLELLGAAGASQLEAGPHVLLVHLPPGPPAHVRIIAYPEIGEQGAPH